MNKRIKSSIKLILLLIAFVPHAIMGEESKLNLNEPIESLTYVDILIIYSPAVKERYLDQDGVHSFILSNVMSFNQAMANSEVPVRLNLIHFAPVDYETSGDLGTDLDRLRTQNNGYMDEVHSLRAEYGADLVALLVDGGGGMALVPRDSSIRIDRGFSVTGQDSALGAYVFAHEIGHNFGCHHAYGDPMSAPGRFNYSYGHRFIASDNESRYRTIMAYQAPIHGGYRRIPYFSNPNVTFQGTPTGVSASEPYPADNAQTIKIMAEIVTQYYEHIPRQPKLLNQPLARYIPSGGAFHQQIYALGSESLTYEWYSNSATNPYYLKKSDQDILLINDVTESMYIWVNASNSLGNVTSQRSFIERIPIDPESITLDQIQEIPNFWRSISATPAWQEFVPQYNYLDSVEIPIALTEGHPGVLFELLAENGVPTYSTILSAEDLPIQGEPISFTTLKIRQFVEAGKKYRIQIQPVIPTSKWIYWRGTQDNSAYPYGESWVNYYWDLPWSASFRTYGYSFLENYSLARSPIIDKIEIKKSSNSEDKHKITVTGKNLFCFQWYKGHWGDISYPLIGQEDATIQDITQGYYWVLVTSQDGLQVASDTIPIGNIGINNIFKWLKAYYGEDNQLNPKIDSVLKGGQSFTLKEAFLLGENPNDLNDTINILINDGNELSFKTLPGRVYSIEISTDLLNWHEQHTWQAGIHAPAGRFNFPICSNNQRAFYRIRVSYPQ